MDKDRIAGAVKEVKGAAKEAIGSATGDAKLRADGRADKAEGKIQNAFGRVKAPVLDALKKYLGVGFVGATPVGEGGQLNKESMT
jgi:uncharacterized protein YjbJ (UPF0337 family)